MQHNRPRALFDLGLEAGVLTTLVLEEFAAPDEPCFDLEEAKRLYVRADCLNAVFVLDWAVRHPEVEHFGFGSIYEGEFSGDPRAAEGDELGSLYFGNLEQGISPTSWLVYLSRRIHEIPLWERLRFDTVCQEVMLVYDPSEHLLSAMH